MSEPSLELGAPVTTSIALHHFTAWAHYEEVNHSGTNGAEAQQLYSREHCSYFQHNIKYYFGPRRPLLHIMCRPTDRPRATRSTRKTRCVTPGRLPLLGEWMSLFVSWSKSERGGVSVCSRRSNPGGASRYSDVPLPRHARGLFASVAAYCSCFLSPWHAGPQTA